MPHHLLFDPRTREGAAIHALFTAIKNDIQDENGRWHGADVVELLDQWFTDLGYDIGAPAAAIDS